MVTLASESREVLTVNPEGAFVESWLSAEGKELLFTRRDMPNGKNRGGIPVCAPIFGPGDTVDLNQHGFARNATWEIAAQTESQVKLTLDNPASQVEALPPVYAGVGMELTIELRENGIWEELILRNIGIDPCAINPGFHPYFPMADGESAEDALTTVDKVDHKLNSAELAATRKVDSTDARASLRTSQGIWHITSAGLPLFAIWSESPVDYICVEPTASGYLTDNPADELQPNETRIVSMLISYEAAA